MKALTLWQPWAELVADRLKPIETRPRPWSFNGIVAIHAGLYVDYDACLRFGYNPKTITRGAVVCLVEKYGCVRFPNSAAPPDEYGDYTAGRYGYLLKDVVKFFTPIPAKGSQGIWEWESGVPTVSNIMTAEQVENVMFPLLQECPACGSDRRDMHGCANQAHGRTVHAYARFECVRCTSSWHTALD